MRPQTGPISNVNPKSVVLRMAKLAKLDDIVALCKRRGFIFQSSEIYGGLASCYDYGPLGVELKRNVREAWWKAVVKMRDDVVGLDCSILMHPMVWKASGHADKFADLVTVCKKCNTRSRVDHLEEGEGHAEEHTEHVDIETAAAAPHDLSNKVCPSCGTVGQFNAPMAFRLKKTRAIFRWNESTNTTTPQPPAPMANSGCW